MDKNQILACLFGMALGDALGAVGTCKGMPAEKHNLHQAYSSKIL